MIKRLKKAFTITELVIVIAVIAILAAVLIPTFSNVIENANQSAALQTCNNALRNYLAEVGTEEDGIEGASSMVFSNDDYAYVYFNNGLHYIGKVSDLSSISLSGDNASVRVKTDNKPDEIDFGAIENNDSIKSSYDVGSITNSNSEYVQTATNTGLTITDRGETASSATLYFGHTYALDLGDDDAKGGTAANEDSLDLVEADGLVAAPAVEGETTKKVETVYFYRVNINDTTYFGFFTLEGSNALRQTEGATYSRRSGISQTGFAVSFASDRTFELVA